MTSKQTQFESDFCTWRAELTEACNELGTCYTTAVEAWKTHRDATKPLIENWKVDLGDHRHSTFQVLAILAPGFVAFCRQKWKVRLLGTFLKVGRGWVS